MAFANGYNGDAKSLQHILQTLDAKTILIPGVTSNGNLQVSAAGEVAYFYKRSSATATNVAGGVGTGVGQKIDYTSKGVERIDVNLINAVQIGAVLPHVNYATVEGADVVADKVIQEAISATNEWNTQAVTFLEDNAERFYNAADGVISTTSVTTNDALTKATVYSEIVKMRKAFNVANKASGMKPTGVIVNEGVYALLLQSDEFIRKEQASDMQVVAEGVIGKVAGLYVVVSPDMEQDIIMLNAEAFAAPININSLMTADATPAGYPAGTIVAGEIGYGFKIGEQDLVLIREN